MRLTQFLPLKICKIYLKNMIEFVTILNFWIIIFHQLYLYETWLFFQVNKYLNYRFWELFYSKHKRFKRHLEKYFILWHPKALWTCKRQQWTFRDVRLSADLVALEPIWRYWRAKCHPTLQRKILIETKHLGEQQLCTPRAYWRVKQ